MMMKFELNLPSTKSLKLIFTKMSIILETLNILAANIISRFTVAVNSCTTTRREGYLTLVYITKHSGVLWPALQQSIPVQQHIRACHGKILGVNGGRKQLQNTNLFDTCLTHALAMLAARMMLHLLFV